MSLSIGSIVWGVHDVSRASKFWCAALNYKPLREPDHDWAILIPVEGTGPQLAIDLITFDTQPRQRHHLDLYAEDQKAEVERLLRTGRPGLSGSILMMRIMLFWRIRMGIGFVLSIRRVDGGIGTG